MICSCSVITHKVRIVAPKLNHYLKSKEEFEIYVAPSSTTMDQPHMRRALEHLKDARRNLEQATADKGGHRARAIQLINEAIEHVNLGIAAAS